MVGASTWTGEPSRITTTLTFGGLVVAMLGLYGVFTTVGFSLTAWPLLGFGLFVSGAGLRRAGRQVRRTAYRPDPWRGPEWLTVTSGVLTLAVFLLARQIDAAALTLQLSPLSWPALSPLLLLGLLVAAAPALCTPPPRLSRAAPRTREAVA